MLVSCFIICNSFLWCVHGDDRGADSLVKRETKLLTFYIIYAWDAEDAPLSKIPQRSSLNVRTGS